jgi:hypothetical protein
MQVYSQLKVASFENLSADPTLLPLGRFWLNTTDSRLRMRGASATKDVLLNDDKIIIGTNGTAANNTRMHRGANGLLQFVSAADVTAEGTLSTALNKLSFRFESYLDASKPAAGNQARIVYATDTKKLYLDDGTNWSPVGGGALVVTGTRSVPVNISAGTAIAVSATAARQMQFIQGNGASVVMSANPQIGVGTDVGQELILVTRNNDQTVGLRDGTGLSLKGDWDGGVDECLALFWDGTNWVEMYRTGRA